MIRAIFFLFVLSVVLFVAGMRAVINYAMARDTTDLSAQLTPEQNKWVKELRNSAGVSCCDDADGIDPQWRVGLGGFEVYHKGEWLKVAPEAVLHQINLIGVSRAWIGYDGTRYFVRCFLAGAQG